MLTCYIGWLHLSERIQISDDLYLYTKDLEFLVLIMYKEFINVHVEQGYLKYQYACHLIGTGVRDFSGYSQFDHLITNSRVKTLGLLCISLEFMY